MEIRSERQLGPVTDEVSAITAVVRPILHGILYSLRREVVAEAGGHTAIKLFMLPGYYNAGDGDAGICFEYAVHDAVSRREPRVAERIVDALRMCKVPGQDIGSILFGMEKAGSQQLIDTAGSLLTAESVLLSGARGRPVKLQRHLNGAAAAFRRRGIDSTLPQSIHGLWKADLILGCPDQDYWVAATVKINPSALQGAKGLRLGVVPASSGSSICIFTHAKRNLVACPLPYDGSFGETFYKAGRSCRRSSRPTPLASRGGAARARRRCSRRARARFRCVAGGRGRGRGAGGRAAAASVCARWGPQASASPRSVGEAEAGAVRAGQCADELGRVADGADSGD